MKKIIFTVLFLHFIFIIANAQWILQNSSGSGLYDVHFINPNTGWACGLGSTILKTTNGGTNWIYQPHPANDRNIMGIHPVDSNVVYCVGYFETILKTTNGGTNWVLLKSGPFSQSPSYNCLFFININTGWICSNNYYIFKTTNGGISFDSTFLFAEMEDIYFKDAMTGLVCGSTSDMFKTTNGGTNWINIPMPTGSSGGSIIYKINFVNNQFGWAIGLNNKVFKTTNFGSSWDSIGYVVGASNIRSSFFSDINTGWAGCVNSSNIQLYKSTNGGYNWIAQINYQNIAFVSSIYFLDNNTGWTVGGGGYIYHTTNGGISFITKEEEVIADEFKLFQNYPNPFNTQTNISFLITKNDKYKL
jgi:photosystem II stability/assembly factor-like uncharacterized protein